MQECRYCGKAIEDTEPFCINCGYDPKTDTVSKDFMQQGESVKHLKKKYKGGASVGKEGINPGVKKFVFFGLAILIFSIFYKNNFNINNVVSEAKYYFVRIVRGKFAIGKIGKDKRDKKNEKVEWINVRTFEENNRR